MCAEGRTSSEYNFKGVLRVRCLLHLNRVAEPLQSQRLEPLEILRQERGLADGSPPLPVARGPVVVVGAPIRCSRRLPARRQMGRIAGVARAARRTAATRRGHVCAGLAARWQHALGSSSRLRLTWRWRRCTRRAHAHAAQARDPRQPPKARRRGRGTRHQAGERAGGRSADGVAADPERSPRGKPEWCRRWWPVCCQLGVL